MKVFLAVLLALALSGVSVKAGERIDLVAPDQAVAGTMTYKIVRIVFDWEHGRFAIMLKGANGARKEVVYGQNTGARDLMRSLNRANFTTKSLHRRLMEKLLADGHLVGSISGVPD